MLRTLLKVCGTVLALGALQAAPGALAARGTLSLSSAEHVAFLGISGDYKEMPADHLAIWLEGERDLELVGQSIRALSDPTRRVWAVRTEDPKKLVRSLKGPLKKRGFKLTALHVTVVEALKKDPRAMRTAQRTVEADAKIWTMAGGRRSPAVWVFHDAKLSSKRVEGLFRKTPSKVAFFHQEFEFTTNEGADLPALTTVAEEKLDALKVGIRENHLVLDLFMRDLDSMLLLKNKKGTEQFLCPDIVRPFLGTGAAGSLDWAVTLENDGFPFVNAH